MVGGAKGDVTEASWGTDVTLAIAIVKTLLLLVGSAVTIFAYRAYRRTDERALAALAVGFGLVTLGLVLAGLLFEVLGVALAVGIVLESTLVLAGFVVIAYALYGKM